MAKRVCLLGATGSIGTQTLEVIRNLNRPETHFEVVALSAGENISLLCQQILEFRPRFICVKQQRDLNELRLQLSSPAQKIEFFAKDEGLESLVTHSQADLVVNGLVGAVGLLPTLAALEAGLDVALANKESLVLGGHLVKKILTRSAAKLVPMDSEHNALFQLLENRSQEEISRVVLTASGGALRHWPLEKLNHVSPEDVLKHPTWQMGKRITVDSATLVNKAFEVIEAHWLFDLSFDEIDVVIHPQSIVHGLVELCDGSVLTHWAAPDMRGPIQYAISYPERLTNRFAEFDWRELCLEFSSLDGKRYPAFEMVVEAGRKGGTFPAVANAADEVAVERFLKGEIPFVQIPVVLEKALESHNAVPNPDLEDVLEADRWAREYAQGL